MPILHRIQEEFGCVPEDAIPVLADKLNITRAEVHGVVSFYHDFRSEPAGRHVVKICQSEACKAVGADALTAEAEAALSTQMGTTRADGGVTLEPVYCLGLCACGPAAMVDGQLVGLASAKRLASMTDGGAA